MRHYYVYLPTKNLVCFSVEKKADKFKYLGLFQDEAMALEKLEEVTGNLCNTNDELREIMGLSQKKYINNFIDLERKINRKWNLLFLYERQITINSELTRLYNAKNN